MNALHFERNSSTAGAADTVVILSERWVRLIHLCGLK